METHLTTNRWWEDAACKGYDTDLFDTKEGDPRVIIDAFCRTCPVRTACLRDALSVEAALLREDPKTKLYYIRGGKTPNERLEIIRSGR